MTYFVSSGTLKLNWSINSTLDVSDQFAVVNHESDSSQCWCFWDLRVQLQMHYHLHCRMLCEAGFSQLLSVSSSTCCQRKNRLGTDLTMRKHWNADTLSRVALTVSIHASVFVRTSLRCPARRWSTSAVYSVTRVFDRSLSWNTPSRHGRSTLRGAAAEPVAEVEVEAAEVAAEVDPRTKCHSSMHTLYEPHRLHVRVLGAASSSSSSSSSMTFFEWPNSQNCCKDHFSSADVSK